MLQKIADTFTQDLISAKNGHKTSLAFIINELPATPLVREDQTFQVMGLGGSIFRRALIEKTAQGLEVKNPTEKPHPIFSTREGFLEYVAENLEKNIKFLAINFAQGVEPIFNQGKLEGKLFGAAKEHKFEGLLGKNICEEIENYILEKENRRIKVSLANDTICLMLSGLTRYPAENLSAGIVGTGTNFAIFLDKTHAVNLEAGGFSNFTPSNETQIIDKNSEFPGTQLWEKEVSGGYLYKHLNLILKENNISYPELTDTKEIDKIIEQNIPQVSDIARELIHDSAQKSAAMMAGIMNFYGRNVTFVMQGSLFWKGYDYKETVAKTTTELSQFEASFVQVENADYLGAAKLLA